MKAYIGYISALRYWREVSRAGGCRSDALCAGSLSDCCRSAGDMGRIELPQQLEGDVRPDVLVPRAGLRLQPGSYTYHVSSHPYPGGSFCKVGRDVLIASPELCFLQMGELLSVSGLVAVGLELCGSYRLRAEGGFDGDCPPLTSPGRLAGYVCAAKGRRGHKTAQRAIRWVLEGSASPMETALFERVCLPRMLGGYAVPLPVLNGFMELTAGQQRMACRSKLYGDLYWPGQNVLLEYDGERAHAGREKLTRDALRDNALAVRKTRRLTVTAELYHDSSIFDTVMCELFRMLGLRIRKPSAEQLRARKALPRELRMQEMLTWR